MATAIKARSLGSFSSKIETAANIATLCTALLVSAVLVKTYLLPSQSRNVLPARLPVSANESVVVGTSLSDRVPGVDWNKDGQTLLLALSTGCHYCTESAPFFR